MKIPAGIDDGMRIRSAGNGEPGTNGGPPGDLYIEIRLKKHDIFERDGDDLHCVVPISFTRAALGGEIEVPTLAGKAAIDIPEGTQAGKQFRLRGKGIKGVRASYPGDLYCHIAVETPVKLTEHQRKLLKELDESLKKGGAKHSPERGELGRQAEGLLQRVSAGPAGLQAFRVRNRMLQRPARGRRARSPAPSAPASALAYCATSASPRPAPWPSSWPASPCAPRCTSCACSSPGRPGPLSMHGQQHPLRRAAPCATVTAAGSPSAGRAVAQRVVDQVVEDAFDQRRVGHARGTALVDAARAQVHAARIGARQVAQHRVAHQFVQRAPAPAAGRSRASSASASASSWSTMWLARAWLAAMRSSCSRHTAGSVCARP